MNFFSKTVGLLLFPILLWAASPIEQTDREFGGLGITITVMRGELRVVQVLSGTPAEESGLQAGDRILAIDGSATKGINLQESLEALTGEAGSRVDLSIGRNGQKAIPVTVTRALINIHSGTWNSFSQKIGSSAFGSNELTLTRTDVTDWLAGTRYEKIPFNDVMVGQNTLGQDDVKTFEKIQPETRISAIMIRPAAGRSLLQRALGMQLQVNEKSIRVRLPQAGSFNLDLLKADGRLVKNIAQNRESSGESIVAWKSETLPWGSYLIRVRQGKLMHTEPWTR